ncbi:MAG TPA: hypothetical protein VFV81_01200 [Verrucomicrobiae bacterium]|nr:hypothetical protein [Verrucomicrobiae bacterium]
MPEGEENYVPEAGEAVLLRCPDFTCVGYRDDDDHWYEYFSGRELPEVLSVEKLSEIEKIITVGSLPRRKHH